MLEGSYPSVGRGERLSDGSVTAEDRVLVPDRWRALRQTSLVRIQVCMSVSLCFRDVSCNEKFSLKRDICRPVNM